ncbi:MAG: carboxypeptidase-like regulatory domain-containing protein, partial [Cytophagaceae bacterium]|nr:carboxypeptidase-like regulatory domain-containing protein [Gemmatimonadaceae bacterium]
METRHMLRLLLSAALHVAALPTEGAIVGTVRDAASGRPVPGAVVIATDAGRQVATDADGRYAIRRVPAGPQHIVVRAMGHTPYTLHAVIPRQGSLELNVSLEPIAERLPRVAVRHLRDATPNSSGRGAGSEHRSADLTDLRRHPMLAEPDVLRAITGGDVSVAPETPGGLHVRGGSADQTGYAIDGIPVFNPFHAADLMGAWNADAFTSAGLGAPVGGASMLSGTLQLTSKTPGSVRHTVGGLSTTHGRVAIDGPVGVAGATFLVSARSAWPNFSARSDDPTFVRVRSEDLMAKVELPLARGLLRGFTTRSLDGVNLASVPPEAIGGAPDQRNTFDWSATTSALQWHGRRDGDSLRASVWRSEALVGGAWADATWVLASHREEFGAQVDGERRGAAGTIRGGARVERSRTRYRVTSEEGLPPDLESRTPSLTVFSDASRPVGASASVGMGLAATFANGRPWLSPRVEGRLALGRRMDLTGSVSRRHQFVQSMRNAESVVGFVFPADLALGPVPGILPVARADEVSLAAELRVAPGVRARASTYAREMRGVVLVASSESAPFAREVPASGSASAMGLSLEGEVSAARYLAMVRYGLQHVRYHHAL